MDDRPICNRLLDAKTKLQQAGAIEPFRIRMSRFAYETLCEEIGWGLTFIGGNSRPMFDAMLIEIYEDVEVIPVLGWQGVKL